MKALNSRSSKNLFPANGIIYKTNNESLINELTNNLQSHKILANEKTIKGLYATE